MDPKSNSTGSDSTGSPAITVEKLARRFRSGDRELVVFENLDLEVREGERVAITGESGAGKSTLLYLLGGLDRPSGGKIYCGQKEITNLTDSELADYRNRHVGFVWQNHSLLPEFTAQENVMMPLLIRGVAPEEADRAATKRLTEVGLESRASHRAGELSGGEQQRVALARALAGNPQILLADEPTGNLDAKTGEMIMALLEQLQHQNQLTLLYVTHNTAFAERADRLIHFEKGHVATAAATTSRSEKPAAGGIMQTSAAVVSSAAPVSSGNAAPGGTSTHV